MTRMLCSLVACTLIIFTVGGCSLFSSDDTVSASELDDQVAGSSDELSEEPLDSEDADEFAEEDDVLGSEDQELAEDDFDESNADSLEDEFGEDDLQDEFETAQISEENQVSDELANEELEDDPFSEEPAAPIVDVPGQEPTYAGNQVTNLEYKAFENGGTVVIETSEPADYQKIINRDANQIVLILADSRLPERFKRPYITKDFKQDIATINAYSDETGASRFVIQLKRPLEPVIQQEGNMIYVMTSAAGPMQASNDPAEQPLDQLVIDNQMSISTQGAAGLTKAGNGSMSLGSEESVFGKSDAKSGLTLGQDKFVGEKINLEFVDADVRTIIEVIAERSGINLIMDKEVEGTSSIRLRNVPWDQALLVLLRSQGLGYVKQGTVLRIAKQATLSAEAEAVSKQIKSEKEAKLLSSGIKVKYIPVSYAKVNELSEKLKEFLSKDGKIAFDERTSSLVITDYGEYIERVLDLVKALDSPPMQVEIESKLVEAREDFTREAGINWDIAGQNFAVGRQNGVINANATNFLGDPNQPQFSMDFNVGVFDVLGNLSASLRIFETQNKIKVLSQPRIVTMNKVEAEIEQNTQIPVLITTVQQGISQTQPQFLDLILSLKVTPQITFIGDVILDVELKREFAGVEATDGNRELNRRKAKTSVMVKNGKTAVIGGIYQLDDTDINNGIPLLKDLPLIGNLFKATTDAKSKNELLLFLKPKILKEIEGPMVTNKTKGPGEFDPFEQLTVDEGSELADEDLSGDQVSDADAAIEESSLEDDLEGEISDDDFDDDFDSDESFESDESDSAELTL